MASASRYVHHFDGHMEWQAKRGVPMCSPVVRFLLIVFVSFLSAVALAQDDPKAKVPLPQTERLQHAGLSDFVVMPDGKTVLSAGRDGFLRFWDIASGGQKHVVRLEGMTEQSRCVILSHDGKMLVAQDGGAIVFWEVASGKQLKTRPKPQANLGNLQFSPDVKTVAVGSWDLKIILCEWEQGNEIRVPLPVRKTRMDSSFHCCYSPDGNWLTAGGGWNETLSVFELATWREMHRLACNAAASRFSPDNKRLAVSSMKNDKGERETVIRLFDLESGKEVAQFPQGHDQPILCLAFSPDGKSLACGCSDRGCLLDAATGRVLHRFPGRSWVPRFTPDGKSLVISTVDHRLRVWDVATGKEHRD
jgi:WD40 repeat protein